MENLTQAIEKINNNDIVGLQELLKNHAVEVDAEDDHGMTLLHHAAFKGKKDFVQLLLDLVRRILIFVLIRNLSFVLLGVRS